MIVEILQKYNLIPKQDLEDYLSKDNLNLYDITRKNKDALIQINTFINNQNNVKKRMYKLIYDNNFLPINCLQWIELNNQYIYTKNKIHIVDNKEIDHELIKHVHKIIKWIASLTNQSPDIEVWIFLCPHKKLFPNIRGKPLGRNEVNSGVTMLSPRESWIQIFRKEEVLKVLIHELLHYYELEIRDEADSIQKELGINFLLNEAYNELFAIYCHTLYYANYKKLDFNECLNKEIKYSENMFNKIIKYYKINNWSDFFKDSYIQYSNVFSYYVLKYLLMEHLDILNLPNKRNISKVSEVIKQIINTYILTIKEPVDYNLSLRMSCLDLI